MINMENNIDIKIDPEFRSIIPPLSADERAELEKSILAEGCRDALVLWGDILIDGHNRLEICRRHGITFQTTWLNFDSRDDVKLWIIKNQLARRNLTDVERARFGLLLKGMFAAQAKERQREHAGTAPGKSGQADDTLPPNLAEVLETRDEVAKIAGVSHGTIQKVETVDKAAPAPVKQAMEDKIISIHAAYEATQAAKKDPELKQKFESAQKEQMRELILAELKATESEIKRQKKIMDFWWNLRTLNYSNEDYEIWLGTLPEDGVDRQLENVERAIENACAIKARFVEVIQERRRLKLVH